MVAARFLFPISARYRFCGWSRRCLAGLRNLPAIRPRVASDRRLKLDYEPRALSRTFAEGANRAVVHFDDCLANRETKAEAFPSSAALLKCLKNLFEMLRLNPNAGVSDFHEQN